MNNLPSLKPGQLASPWAKSKEIYGISVLFSLPTAYLIGLAFEDASDPVTAVLPDALRITFVIALAGLTLVATAVSNTALRAFAATGYLYSAAALSIGAISFSMDDPYYAMAGMLLILSALVALIISTISLSISSRRAKAHRRKEKPGC